MGQEFFVLSGIENLSHTGFAIKRMKLSFPNTLIVGEERRVEVSTRPEVLIASSKAISKDPKRNLSTTYRT